MDGDGGGLEDRILKQNIPGKYTWWDEYNDKNEQDKRNNENEGDDYDKNDMDHEIVDETDPNYWVKRQQEFVKSNCPEPIRKSIMNGEMRAAEERMRRNGAGPKGVLRDYADHVEMQKAIKMIENDIRKAQLDRIVNGAVRQPDSTTNNGENVQKTNDSDDDWSDDDDDDFLSTYRQQRLKEMKANAAKPTFGHVNEVTPFQFVDEVDQEDSRVKIVVHFYEPYIQACQKVNQYLQIIARENQFVKFIRLRALQAKPDYDPIALPTIMVYQGGELIHTFVRIMEDIGDNFTKEDLDWWFASHDIFEGIKLNEPKKL